MTIQKTHPSFREVVTQEGGRCESVICQQKGINQQMMDVATCYYSLGSHTSTMRVHNNPAKQQNFAIILQTIIIALPSFWN